MPGRVLAERLARQLLDQRPKHDEVDVAIDEGRARRPVGCHFKRHAIRRLLAFPFFRQIEVFRQSRVVDQQLADGDVLLAILRKFGEIPGNRIGHAKFALFPKLHECRCGCDWFRKRSAVEDCVECHGLAPRNDGAAAVGLAVYDLATMADDEHRTGNLLLRNGVVDNGVQDGKAGLERLLSECDCVAENEE